MVIKITYFMSKNWYRDVNKECKQLAKKHGIEVWQVAGIITALSAQKKWDLNIKQAYQVLNGEGLTGLVSDHQLKTCERILEGEHPLDVFAPESYKYRNFFLCITEPNDPDHVCVDTHMINWYLNLHPHSKLQKVPIKRIFDSRPRYLIIQDFIRKQAKALGLLPMELQAIVWIDVRKK